jgi:peptidoglycan-N-acetylglucosamine deacetylase
MALLLCRMTGVQPSILLHPLDFLGCDDEQDLSFFPAMNLPANRKVSIVASAIDQLSAHYRIVTMSEHADAVRVAQRGVVGGTTTVASPAMN